MTTINTKIADSIARFIDSNYAVDDPAKGYDCLNSLVGFYKAVGVDILKEFNDEFEGWTIENYGERALKDPDAAHKQFEKFVMRLGQEVNPHYIRHGDLLIFKIKEFGNYAGIFLGNGNVFCMFDKGGRVCPLAPFREFIVSARRLIKDESQL